MNKDKIKLQKEIYNKIEMLNEFDELPEKDKKILALVLRDNKTFKEASKELGVCATRTSGRYSEALANIALILLRNYV